ncbi:MAG TPA: AAA family ATPase [Bryobacteraceae bacterium]|nr:AAA family ATPase [Bryobacteraceae bacterium]
MKEADRQRAIRQKLARADAGPRPALLTGFASLDAVTGGLPRGGIVELFGTPGCGKTTLALQIAAHVQHAGGAAVWIDAEHAFDAALAMRLGVAVERMPVAQPGSAEEALEMLRRLAASGAVDLLVVDSAAALVPEIELATRIGEAGSGMHSRVLASGLRRLAAAIRRSEAVALFLNQMRGSAEDDPDTAAGGAPLKLFAAVRLAMRAGAPGGQPAVVRAVKNKAGGAAAGCLLAWKEGVGFAESP